MAVVGSLVLSLSSILNKNNKGHKSILVFHISRLIGFFLLGGMLGILGTLFLLSSTIEIAIGIFLFLVMLALGINLLDISPFFRKFEFTLPKNISSKFLNKKNMTNTIAPILFGAGTFFLPCGFTQAMQLNAVVSANFLDGALIMLVFALGTFPVLAIISFSSKRISQSKYSDLFFKTSGFIVIFFAIYNLIGTLVANGIISPIF
jgi:sulfite exporter TauE/SafE